MRGVNLTCTNFIGQCQPTSAPFFRRERNWLEDLRLGLCEDWPEMWIPDWKWPPSPLENADVLIVILLRLERLTISSNSP